MARKTIATIHQPDTQLWARVQRDAEWDEYRVRYYQHAQHIEGGDYHTDDKADALATARVQLAALALAGTVPT